MSRTIEIIVVGNRCVYVNDHRVAGKKPYVSEQLPHQTFHTTLSSILDAFTLEALQEAVAQRQAKRAPTTGEQP